MPDIDLDFADRKTALQLVKHVPARLQKKKHNTGVYTHRVPVDPVNGYCTIDHKEADDNGYFKLDVLNVSIYKDVQDDNHLDKLINKIRKMHVTSFDGGSSAPASLEFYGDEASLTKFLADRNVQKIVKKYRAKVNGPTKLK